MLWLSLQLWYVVVVRGCGCRHGGVGDFVAPEKNPVHSLHNLDASESGINVSDRALPVTCEIDRTPIGNAAGALDANGVGQDANDNIRYDIWAMTDLILYITMDGQMSTRI